MPDGGEIIVEYLTREKVPYGGWSGLTSDA